MLKMARRLTHPTPARQDAPFRRQGHSSEANPSFHVLPLTFHGCWERSKNAAGDFSAFCQGTDPNQKTFRSRR